MIPCVLFLSQTVNSHLSFTALRRIHSTACLSLGSFCPSTNLFWSTSRLQQHIYFKVTTLTFKVRQSVCVVIHRMVLYITHFSIFANYRTTTWVIPAYNHLGYTQDRRAYNISQIFIQSTMHAPGCVQKFDVNADTHSVCSS